MRDNTEEVCSYNAELLNIYWQHMMFALEMPRFHKYLRARIHLCELRFLLSSSWAIFVLLQCDVSVLEHPFHVLIRFLLGSVAV